MKVAIVLGKWLHDDGSISDILIKRLELAMELYNQKEVDKIIVSGGMANEKAKVTEAFKMKEYLLSKNILSEDILLEDKSTTTGENALFSIPIALNLKADKIVICSTHEHFIIYNVMKIFLDKLKDKDIRVYAYTDSFGE